MRLRAIVFVVLAFGLAGYAAWRVGGIATAHVEAVSRAEVSQGLSAGGEDWATVAADGLVVRVEGAAPDEARRLRALEIARRIVDPGRVVDATTLADAMPAAPPAFALELMRRDGAVVAIGLAPEAAAPALARALEAMGGPAEQDLVVTVAADPPEGWQAAFDYGLGALALLSQARVSVEPGHVAVDALAASSEEAAALRARLEADRPAGVAVSLAVDAPRAAIAPYRLDLTLAPDGAATLAACAAETEADAAAILAAAGLAGDCALGPGAPSADWPRAAEAGIAALHALGAGRLVLSDAELALTPAAEAGPAQIAAAEAALARLPAGFDATLAPAPAATPAPAPASPAAAAAVGAEPVFRVARDHEGVARLEGPAGDPASRDAIAAVAAARFGHDSVENAMTLAGGLPPGWTGRALAGVEALALLREGTVTVTPDGAAAVGEAEAVDGAGAARRLLSAAAPGRIEIAIRFDAAAAAAEARARALAEDPAGACLGSARATMAETPIAFEAGSAELDAEGEAAVTALARTLALCAPVDLEVGGHTDGAGDPERNLALSAARAETVRLALEEADLPHIRLVARGYGSAHPIGDNDTPEGRAANRRIELTLTGASAPAAAAPEAAAPLSHAEPFVGPK